MILTKIVPEWVKGRSIGGQGISNGFAKIMLYRISDLPADMARVASFIFGGCAAAAVAVGPLGSPAVDRSGDRVA